MALTPGALLWLVPLLTIGIPQTFLDWKIYGEAAQLWAMTGTPYTSPPAGWDPDVYHPYLYPPTSWPLLVLVRLAPPVIVTIGLIPFLVTLPRRWAAIPVAALLFLAAVPGVLLANVNVLVAGALVVAFAPGVVGGLAFAAVVAVKGYPIVILPLIWGDRRRAGTALVALAVLAATGTLLWGAESWGAWLSTLATEGRYVASINPLATDRTLALVLAGAGVIGGLALRSPTLTLVASTLATPALSIHYVLTYAAGLVREPSLESRVKAVGHVRNRAQSDAIEPGVDRAKPAQ